MGWALGADETPMRWLCTVMAMIAVVVAASGAALADPPRRVALIIGNSNYAHAGALKNPLADSALMEAAFSRAGFIVDTEANLSNGAMRDALRRFSAQAAGAEVAAVYYAGHGIEARGANWLLPTDTVLQNDSDLDYEAINLDLVMRATSGAKMRMVVLDACRDNPFGRGWSSEVRAVSQGLAEVNADNVLVIYAAAPGQTAMDGAGANSPFAQALAQRLPEPGMEIHILGGKVRDDVLRATANRQRPYVSASITGEPFVFVQGNVTVNVTPAPAPAPTASTFDPRQADMALWASVGSSNDAAQLNAYLAQFPNGMFAGAARAKIAALTRPAPVAAPIAQPSAGIASQISGTWSWSCCKNRNYQGALTIFDVAADGTFAASYGDDSRVTLGKVDGNRIRWTRHVAACGGGDQVWTGVVQSSGPRLAITGVWSGTCSYLNDGEDFSATKN